uniref:Uncharacterized protein n=1 Tax=viral metagenome TaxID=1070528 RepID=A0A6M3IFA8_9ZZZZ
MAKITQKNLDKLNDKLDKRLRKLKLRIVECEEILKTIDEKISKEVNNKTRLEIIKMVQKSVEFATKNTSKIVLKKVISKYIKFANKLVSINIETEIKKGINWQTKSIEEKKCDVKKINELYKNGWKIVYHGKLGGEEDFFIFDKPNIINQKEKKKKDKITRKPVK